MLRYLLPTCAIALLLMSCAARHLAVPGCASVQAVIPSKCEANSYIRVVGNQVEIVCVMNGKEKVSLVRCQNKLEESK